MSWKRMKGIRGANSCPKCHRHVHDDEYDFDEDQCLFCGFEGVSASMPVKYDKKYGDLKNTTSESEVLEDIEYTPEKQSKASIKSRREYEFKKAKRKKR